MHSEKETADYTVGRIWNWISNEKRIDSKTVPDVILPWGILKENTKASLPGIGQGFKWIALLPNVDLVIGPDMIGGDNSDSNEIGRETKNFKSDMIYLKKAIIGGTIIIANLPK